MNTIILGLILVISIGILLAGLRMTMISNMKKEENQERLNTRILSGLPQDFRLDK